MAKERQKAGERRQVFRVAGYEAAWCELEIPRRTRSVEPAFVCVSLGASVSFPSDHSDIEILCPKNCSFWKLCLRFFSLGNPGQRLMVNCQNQIKISAHSRRDVDVYGSIVCLTKTLWAINREVVK